MLIVIEHMLLSRKDMKKKILKKVSENDYILVGNFFPTKENKTFTAMYCWQKASTYLCISLTYILKAKMDTRHCKKKDSEISHFEIQVGVCQFPKNVLNEGSEHLEVYELQKSISHLTSHLIIITAVIFFLL